MSRFSGIAALLVAAAGAHFGAALARAQVSPLPPPNSQPADARRAAPQQATGRQQATGQRAAAPATNQPAKKSAAPQRKPPAPVSRGGAPIRDEEHRFRRHVASWTEIKTRNIVMQQREYSCGAAAVATLIKYHWGKEITEAAILVQVFLQMSEEELRDRIEKGLSLTDLRKAAVKFGYLATIGKLEFEKLRESKVPVVVGIRVDKFDHFVVYRGADDRYVYLADPARGHLRVPIPEFLKQWQENAVLVIVDKERVKNPNITSALTVREDEKFFGEVSRTYLRRRTTAMPIP